MVNVVYIVFKACVLLHRHLEQNAFVQRRQKVVKVDMLETTAHFLSQVVGNMFTILLVHSIKWILQTQAVIC